MVLLTNLSGQCFTKFIGESLVEEERKKRYALARPSMYIYILNYIVYIYIYTCIQRYIHTSCKWIQLDGCERFVLFYNTLDNTACILLHVSFL